ncbi:MAG: hypothetical protein ABII00_06605 [Elusimicrobiota bacterium]
MAALALIGLLAVLQLLCVPGHYLGREHDDVQYVLAARALLEGRYSLGVSPGDPPLTFVTPGWPLLLTPAAAVAPEASLGYELWAWGWLALCDLLAWLWFRRRMRAPAAAAATALFALNPLVLARAGVVMSEVPFLAVTLATLLLLERGRTLLPGDDAGHRAGPEFVPGLAGGVSGLLLGFAFLIRPGALPLLPAVWCWYLWKGRRRDAAWSAAVALAPILAWRAWVGAKGARLAEAQELSMTLWGTGPAVWLGVARDNLVAALTLWGDTLLPWGPGAPHPGAALALGCLLAVMSLAGVGLLLRRGGCDAGALFLLGGIALHLAWPWWYDRYLLPYLPFLIWGLWHAVVRVARSERIAAVVFAAATLLPLPAKGTAFVRAASARGRPELSRTYAWIRDNTPQEALFAAAFYTRDAYYTGRPFVPLPFCAEGALAETLRAHRVRYVLWQRPPGLGSSLGPAFRASRMLRNAGAELGGAGFRAVHRAPGEAAALYELTPLSDGGEGEGD